MTYTYEGRIEKVEGDWLITFPQFDGAFGGGGTIGKACRNASEALRLAIADALANGEKLPRARFSNSPQAVFAVDVDEEYIRETECLTVGQAAQRLSVSSGRVSQLIEANSLDDVVVNGKRMVTIASINAYKANSPASQRPCDG